MLRQAFSHFDQQIYYLTIELLKIQHLFIQFFMNLNIPMSAHKINHFFPLQPRSRLLPMIRYNETKRVNSPSISYYLYEKTRSCKRLTHIHDNMTIQPKHCDAAVEVLL